MVPFTMSQVARELGVSKNTVSLALRGDPQIPAATSERVRSAARRMGYSINPVVSHLMAELRRSRSPESTRTLGLVNAYRTRDAFRIHPTLPTYVEGCRRRAAAQGYGLDRFWLQDPELDGPRLNRILAARGVRGIVVVGMMDDPCLPDRFAETWVRHACVVTGFRPRQPSLSFCCVDHHALVLQAIEQALLLGYRRPALVIDGRLDRLVEGRFSSGMWIGQQGLDASQRVRSFDDAGKAQRDPSRFHAWLDEERPDVLLTLYAGVRRLVEESGRSVPRDIGLIQLELRKDTPDWAGMDQHNDLTGEAAIDLVISMLHNNELGVPRHPKATLIEASWVAGPTVRRQVGSAPKRASKLESARPPPRQEPP